MRRVYFGQYRSVYPPAFNSTYVKSTTESACFEAYRACDPSNSLLGSWQYTSWISKYGSNTNQRFHIDLGGMHVIKRIYYENNHNSGGDTNVGAKNFSFWGSNIESAFTTLTYSTDTNWTALTVSDSQFDQHTASNVTDPKYSIVTNSSPFRYYAVKIADSWGSGSYVSFRRIILQELF